MTIGIGASRIAHAALYGGVAVGVAAATGGVGVEAPLAGMAAWKIGSGAAMVGAGLVKRRYRISGGKRGAKKGHEFYGNQHTRVSKYQRGKRAVGRGLRRTVSPTFGLFKGRAKKRYVS